MQVLTGASGCTFPCFAMSASTSAVNTFVREAISKSVVPSTLRPSFSDSVP